MHLSSFACVDAPKSAQMFLQVALEGERLFPLVFLEGDGLVLNISLRHRACRLLISHLWYKQHQQDLKVKNSCFNKTGDCYYVFIHL